MNIFLTGMSGFMGRHVAKKLLNEGHQLFAPVRAESLNKINALQQYPNLKIIKGTFYDSAVLSSIKSPIDAIVHLASIRGAGKAPVEKYQLVNVDGTQNLLNWARKREITRFLYISTVGVLGSIPSELPACVNSPLAADGIYHQSKVQAEKIILQFLNTSIKFLILRPTITYGPGDDGFLKKMVALIQNNKMVLANSDILIHLLDVQAFSELINQIIKKDLFNNNIYLIADQQPVSLKKLADLIKEGRGGHYWQFPDFVFYLVKKTTQLLKMDALKTSLQLISESWYYDITPALQDLDYIPADTEQQIKEYLKNNVY